MWLFFHAQEISSTSDEQQVTGMEETAISEAAPETLLEEPVEGDPFTSVKVVNCIFS